MANIDLASKPAANAAATNGEPELELPSDPVVVLLGGLFLLALLAAVYVAKEIVLPILLAFVLKLLLNPAVRAMERLHVPRLIGSILAIWLLVGGVLAFGLMISGPAAGWAAKLPAGLPRLEYRLSALKDPIESLQKTLRRAEKVAETAAPKGETVTVAVQPQSGLSEWLFSGTRAMATGLLMTVILLFFLLVAGDTFLRRTVEVLPRFRDKRQAVEISQAIERDIAIYLATITAMNTLVGGATALIMFASGIGDPILWGGIAFLLNFAPIVGPVVGAAMFTLAGLLTFDSLTTALLPAGLYFAVHILEGQFITPMLLAKRFTLNPVLVILTLVFWYWMWGVPGAILAVPMLSITKIVCDRVQPLRALGHFLGG
jgi:predicted PurR-regulated permease PerM